MNTVHARLAQDLERRVLADLVLENDGDSAAKLRVVDEAPAGRARDRRDHRGAWQDYLNLCRAGGSRSFLELVRLANLRSPFEDGCVESVVGEIRAYLAGVEDGRL